MKGSDMNKYKEDFDMVTRLCALDGRERTILNYGIEEGRTKAIDEFAERLTSRIKTEIDDCTDELDWINEIAEEMRGAE